MIRRRETIVDAEAALVGVLVTWPQVIDQVPPTLAGSDFTDRDLGACFEAIMHRHRTGQPITGPLVSAALTEAQANVLADAMAAASTSAHVAFHGQAVLASGVYRQLRGALTAIANQEPGRIDPRALLGDVACVCEAADSRLAGATAIDGVGAGDGLAAVLKRAEAARDGQLTGIQTGLAMLDYYSGGLQPAAMIVVGARTSLGKSAFTGQLAVHAARGGAKVAVLSFEMSAVDFFRRFAAAASGINGVLIREGRLSRGDWSALTSSCNDLARDLDDRLVIFDRVSRDIGVVLVTARRLHRQGRLDLLVVDFLQKLRLGRDLSRTANRNSELEQISGALADLGRELQIPVVVGSQLNRGAEGVRPTLATLRDSGTIEQDADLVLAIHGERDGDERELLILKNRDGRCGTISTRFDRNRLVFVEEPHVQP